MSLTIDLLKVQESTKFCFGDSGPVCECGIAVRAGQDVFMLDRCGDVNYLDFPQCGDGGILDVDVANDYQYTVVLFDYSYCWFRVKYRWLSFNYWDYKAPITLLTKRNAIPLSVSCCYFLF